GDEASLLADHHGELALPVDLRIGHEAGHDRLPVAHHRSDGGGEEAVRARILPRGVGRARAQDVRHLLAVGVVVRSGREGARRVEDGRAEARTSGRDRGDPSRSRSLEESRQSSEIPDGGRPALQQPEHGQRSREAAQHGAASLVAVGRGGGLDVVEALAEGEHHDRRSLALHGGELEQVGTGKSTAHLTPGGRTMSHDVQRGLEYGTHDGVTLTGDLYVPTGAGSYPAIVAVHGGGWQIGDASFYQHWGPYLAERGYALFSIDYRLVKDGKR